MSSSSSSSVMSGYYCVKERKPCVRWVHKYFKDCLCNIKDDVSFGFGILSLVCWGVAEIPQIITNFRTKSSHGVSLAFLFTWVAGDVFNLLGCFLEPATLPTQFYTALLYTTSTVVLVLQSLYYDHIYRWRKRRHVQSHTKSSDENEPFRPKADQRAIPIPDTSSKASPRRDFYYTSARSLAGSGTPPFRSFINVRVARSGPSALELNSDHSSSDDEAAPPILSNKPSKPAPSRSRPIPQSASYGTFFATAASLPFQSKGLYVGLMTTTSRRLLQEGGMEHSVVGQWLGWLMATIYMGGRIPQIYLNIKRGSVEGLNPLMFVFALVANVAYVGSIVVRTTEWESIKPNMAWLLDAVVCVVLDLFIILQYIYYRYLRKSESDDVQEDPKDASF